MKLKWIARDKQGKRWIGRAEDWSVSIEPFIEGTFFLYVPIGIFSVVRLPCRNLVCAKTLAETMFDTLHHEARCFGNEPWEPAKEAK